MGPHQLDLQEYHEASRAPWSHCCRPQGTWVARKGQEGLKAAPFAHGDIPQAPEAPAPHVALGEIQELVHWPNAWFFICSNSYAFIVSQVSPPWQKPAKMLSFRPHFACLGGMIGLIAGR